MDTFLSLQDQFDRSRFGKSKVHKKEVKSLIGERKTMKESLTQVLQKLVLLKDPSPDVDGKFYVFYGPADIILNNVSLFENF